MVDKPCLGRTSITGPWVWLSIVAWLFGPGCAFAASAELDEVRLGGAVLAASPLSSSVEMEWLFSPLPTAIKPYDPHWAWLFSPRPIIGASISAQDKTDEAYAGLAWDIPLTHGFNLEYQESGLIHNQALNVLYNDRPSPLTTRLLFREAIGLSYDINQSWRVMAFADHASDGNLGYRNEGINRFGFLVGYKPGTPAAPQPPEPPPPPNFNWNGPYAGLSVALARSNYNLVQPASNEQTNADNSVNIAAQAGFNWMIGPILAGFEADYSVQGLRGDAKAELDDAAVSASSLWLATARGRLGVSMPVPKVPGGILLYGTGGPAFSEIANGYCPHSSSVICYNTSTGDVAGGWATQSKLQTGWTAGGGVEIPMAPTFTVKFEYLYVDFGKLSFSNDAVPGEQFTFTEQILRTGMNFKFN